MAARILLVDDEPNITSALGRRLRREGFEVLAAHSGKQALERLAEGGVDVIVTDEKMPGMQGSELVAQVAARYPQVIRMMLSGEATLDAAVRAINEGQIYRFFLKPCDETDLVFSIRQALEQRDLSAENLRLRAEVEEKMNLLRQLEQDNPGITRVEEDEDGALVIDLRES